MRFEEVKLDQLVCIRKPTILETPSSSRLYWYSMLEELEKLTFTVRKISTEVDYKTNKTYKEVALVETSVICDASWLQLIKDSPKKKSIALWLSRVLDCVSPSSYKAIKNEPQEISTKTGFTLKKNATYSKEEWSWGHWWY